MLSDLISRVTDAVLEEDGETTGRTADAAEIELSGGGRRSRHSPLGSGGVTTAALLAGQAHSGTEGPNPFPSTTDQPLTRSALLTPNWRRNWSIVPSSLAISNRTRQRSISSRRSLGLGTPFLLIKSAFKRGGRS